MKRLVIRNFGPLSEAILDFGRVNVITGMQSSGKSCLLKTACFCAWVEKRILLSQEANGFANGSAFLDNLTKYYNMKGFVNPDTFIEYETGQLRFSYDNSDGVFRLKWKSGRWMYRRPQISYIPAGRNLVSALDRWSTLELDEYMVDFISNWDRARRFVKEERNFLNLGMSYRYDKNTGTDTLQLKDGKSLTLKESSSGVQSLVPMFVHLDYLSDGQYRDSASQTSFQRKEERRNFLRMLYGSFTGDYEMFSEGSVITIDGYDYRFANDKDAELFKKRYDSFINTDHSEIFLEEPEDNLFPPTQAQFVDWILENISYHKDTLSLTTHSPYILDRFIKRDPKGLCLFFTHPLGDDSNKYVVKKLSDKEVRELYEGGIDIFFNFEYFL